MKSIEQLLELKKNPYYQFSPEEQGRLNDFLSKNSEQKTQQKDNSNDSEKNTPVTVLNKNVVHKETGVIPTNEEASISKQLADVPVASNDQDRANPDAE